MLIQERWSCSHLPLPLPATGKRRAVAQGAPLALQRQNMVLQSVARVAGIAQAFVASDNCIAATTSTLPGYSRVLTT